MAALYPVPMVQAADSGHAIYAGPVFSSCCEKKWLFSLTATNTRLRYHTLLASHTTFESKLSLSYNYVFITPKHVTVGGSAKRHRYCYHLRTPSRRNDAYKCSAVQSKADFAAPSLGDAPARLLAPVNPCRTSDARRNILSIALFRLGVFSLHAYHPAHTSTINVTTYFNDLITELSSLSCMHTPPTYPHIYIRSFWLVTGTSYAPETFQRSAAGPGHLFFFSTSRQYLLRVQ